MAITYGYFDSINGDRKYNADQMSEYFDGIVSDGVFQSVGGALAVSAQSTPDMSVKVASGRAIINSKWIKNDADITLPITAASTAYARITSVVVQLDPANRLIKITTKDGTPSGSPVAPEITENELEIARITVAANATSIADSAIKDKREYVHGVINQVDWGGIGGNIANQSDLQNSLGLINARIDNIIALPDGSTTADAELTDIRIGADGVTFPTAGDAVRAQVNKLSNNFSSLYDTNHNYNVGDFCIYQLKLYRCKTATTGAWNVSKWQEIKIDNLQQEEKENINYINKIISDFAIDPNPFYFSDASQGNFTASFNSDGALSFSGGNSSATMCYTDAKMYLYAGTNYLKCNIITGTVKPTIYISSDTNNQVGFLRSIDTETTITIPEDGFYSVWFFLNANATANITGYFWINQNAQATYTKPNGYKYIKESELDHNTLVISEVTEIGKNKLKPLLGTQGNLTKTYSEDTGYIGVTGTKTSSDPLRVIMGTISCEETATYAFSCDINTGYKPSMFICKGTEIIETWGKATSIVYPTLTANEEYTLEAFFENGAVNLSIRLQCEKGTAVTSFRKYGYAIKPEALPEYEQTNTVDLSSKKFSICGVSIDTYQGWIPSGNVSYYTPSNLASVDMTWWKKLMNSTGIQLVVNNSWSGACASTIKGLESSGVQRCISLDNGLSDPDIIIVGMFGANDWAWSSIGSYSFDTSLPGANVDLTNESNYNTYKDIIESYAGAMATIFYRLHQKYPNARIYALDMYNYFRNAGVDPTGRDNAENVPIFNKMLYNICEWFGVTVIKTSECGINAVNSREYCVESSGVALHPNDSGHTLIYESVLARLKYDYK